MLLGELGLDGRVRAVRGILPGAAGGSPGRGFGARSCPQARLRRRDSSSGLAVVGVATLADLIAVLRGERRRGARGEGRRAREPRAHPRILRTWWGRLRGKWALEVAAAGGHHLFLKGPPGVGKTLLAERLTGILPDLGPLGGARGVGDPLVVRLVTRRAGS